jgi:ABC-2 type transport system ATP-binding protein
MSNQTNSTGWRSEAVAVMRHVTRFFENPGFVRALTNVSFDIRRGEVFGLLGPKGSGKSTALRILSGNLSTSEGKVKVFGRSPRRRSVKSRTGYLAQDDSNAARHFFARIVSFLSQLFARNRAENTPSPPQTFRRRRASLAQILAKAPELIILDEPFAGLDPVGCAEIKDLLLALIRRGKTIVLSGDSLYEARDVCTRMAVLYAGSIQAIGTLPDLLTHPEAIRFMAPLLPPATAECVRDIICRDLLSPGAQAAASQPDATAETPAMQPSNSEHFANEMLSPLLKKQVSLSVEPAAPALAHIDHEKLASLIRQTEP